MRAINKIFQAVYVSALDFFAWDANGNKNGGTMGLATVGGVCNDAYNCVIAEFGSINQFGKPYPSSGFISVYILAHEIGHNLGMPHDSSENRRIRNFLKILHALILIFSWQFLS